MSIPKEQYGSRVLYCSAVLTSHFFLLHLTGTENGPIVDANWTSPSRSSLICRDQIIYLTLNLLEDEDLNRVCERR